MSTAPPQSATYLCPYCRLQSDGTATACPFCGAPVNVRERVSRAGWEEQPGVKDMARLQIGRSHVQIAGNFVPTADFSFDGPEWIYFSHHSLLWADPTVKMESLPMATGWSRVKAGMPLVMMRANGPGHLALSDDDPGEIVALPLLPGREYWVREHRFLAATGNVTYSWDRTHVWFTTGTGDDKEWHYPCGQYYDRFFAQDSPGLLLLHSPGNTFIRDLQPGETICVQPGAVLYKDASVGMQLHLEYPHQAGITWRRSYSYRSVLARLWGPGRVAVQSVYTRPEASEPITSHSQASTHHW
jgi:uncharacterized protein (AIM24 family)